MSALLDHHPRAPLLAHSSLEREDYILYQPNPTKQILLYDMATSSSVLTYLKMKELPTAIKNLMNTEFMSENGRMPVVLDRGMDEPICGFKEVFLHVSRKLKYTPSLLELAYMDWIESKFLEAEMYICWCYKPILDDYTQNRYTHEIPWPASTILFARKRCQVQNDVGKKFKDYKDFLEKFSQFLTQLNKRIGNRPYCLSETSPSCVDALIYGHTKAILNTKLDPKLTDAITRQRRIITLTELIDRDFPS